MEYAKITKLYKYRRCDSRSLDLLSRNSMWFAPSHSFNDPFDCAVRREFKFKSNRELIERFAPIEAHHRNLSPDEAVAHLKQVVADANLRERYLQDKSRSFQRVVLRSFGIYTMSKTPKEILMWSHYAEGHKGFCIEYHRTPNNMLAGAGKVKYLKADEFPRIDYFVRDPQKRLDEVSKIVLNKSKHWKYEQEWRMVEPGYVDQSHITYTKERSDHQLLDVGREPYSGHESTYPDEMLNGIIFGLQMNDKDKKAVREVLSGKDIKYYEVSRVRNKVELKIRETP